MLARIRSELGADAVILSTRTCDDGGAKACEITAALDDAATTARSANGSTAPSRSGGSQSRPGDSIVSDLMDNQPSQFPGWSQWHREWQSIKEHLNALMKPQMDLARLTPRQRLPLEYLEREGASPEIVARIYRALVSDKQASVLGPLEKAVPVTGWSLENWPQKVHALAGPHGAGKTTSLIRMAFALRRENPALKILIVNADTTKSAGRMLLRQYAELAEFEYCEATSGREFLDAATRAQVFDRVLVDLPAVSRGETLVQVLDRIGFAALADADPASGYGVIHLALSPIFAPEQISAFIRSYASERLAGIVWTKLDEAFSFGSMINAGESTGLPAVALSYGAGLRDTLAPAKSAAFWRLVFKHRLPGTDAPDRNAAERGAATNARSQRSARPS
ncbi:MAG: hypothetical protein ACOCWR_01505 [Oceanidesulfovibrio sp.]